MASYLPRILDRVLDEVLGEFDAIAITGLRACGKTTTAARRARSVVHLDAIGQAAAFRADPDAALAMQETPVLLDEWQETPEVLGAVKRAVDAGTSPGRFILTGSVRARNTAVSWPATGRVLNLELHGITQAEIHSSSAGLTLLDTLGSGHLPDPARLTPTAPTTVVDYVALALASGFPQLIGRTPDYRERWLESYLAELVVRDAAEVASIRAPERLAALLRALALSTASTPRLATLAQAADLDGRTLANYLDLLTDLRILERLPAWRSNRLSRLTTSPKYYLTDPALAATAAHLDEGSILDSGDALGRTIDTFVLAQLRPLLQASCHRWQPFHLRDQAGRHEIDIVLESRRGAIVGIEVKAASAVSAKDARHLHWLRDMIGDRFAAGIVFHTGPAAYPLGEKTLAIPIASLWRNDGDAVPGVAG